MRVKEHLRAQWMGRFCDAVEAAAPHMAGRIDWTTATLEAIADGGMTAKQAAGAAREGLRL
jgi:hypothetical protein